MPKKWTHDASGAEISWLLPSIGGWCTGLTDRQGQMSKWIRKDGDHSSFSQGWWQFPVSMMQGCMHTCDDV